MKNKYKIAKSKKEVFIELNHKHLGKMITIIDYEDFEKINQYNTTWFIGYKNGHIDGIKTKVQINYIRTPIWLHRLIMDCPDGLVIDHINGNTLDNRKKNLRIVTKEENATNLSSISNNLSGYTNIYKDKNLFRVSIGGKKFGSYKTLKEAKEIRDKHLKEIFPLRER